MDFDRNAAAKETAKGSLEVYRDIQNF